VTSITTLASNQHVGQVLDTLPHFVYNSTILTGHEGTNMLTYEHQEIYIVKNDGKIIGEICSKGFGYRYWPKGVTNIKYAGTKMSSVDCVKKSLEHEHIMHNQNEYNKGYYSRNTGYKYENVDKSDLWRQGWEDADHDAKICKKLNID
jgi:hypothetical protein